MVQRQRWVTLAVFILAAIGQVAAQPVDPNVRASIEAEFSQQISLQRVALLGQLGGPNSAFGGLGVLSSLNQLQGLAAFGNTFNNAQDLSTLIQALTAFEQQIAQLSGSIVCRNRVPGCNTCTPDFATCAACLPPFILGPAGTACLPAPPVPGVAPFATPAAGGYGGATPGGAGPPVGPGASFFAASATELQAAQQTAIAANFPIGK